VVLPRLFLCEEWELRLTRRCLEEDLGRSPDTNFGDLLGVEIIKAFIARRRERHDNTREVAPLTSGKTVWRLSRGHDHRGATWYDPDDKVVWLLAYGLHRSGEPEDAFPYFSSWTWRVDFCRPSTTTRRSRRTAGGGSSSR
jgi:hypothetical protein